MAHDLQLTARGRLFEAGEAYLALHDETIRDVSGSRIQYDGMVALRREAKECREYQAAPEGSGDVWTWTKIVASTKLIVPYFVAGRTSESAIVSMAVATSRRSSPAYH